MQGLAGVVAEEDARRLYRCLVVFLAVDHHRQFLGQTALHGALAGVGGVFGSKGLDLLL